MAQGGTPPDDVSPQAAGSGTGPGIHDKGGVSNRLVLWIATVGGVGWIRPAPGTWGSLAGTAVAYFYRNGMGEAAAWDMSTRTMAVVLVMGLALVCIPVCTRAGQLLGRVDPGCVVVDEFLAMLLILAVPERLDLLTAAVGLGLFRLFDIAKPWPVSAGERLPQGWGVMADDLIAAGIVIALQSLIAATTIAG